MERQQLWRIFSPIVNSFKIFSVKKVVKLKVKAWSFNVNQLWQFFPFCKYGKNHSKIQVSRWNVNKLWRFFFFAFHKFLKCQWFWDISSQTVYVFGNVKFAQNIGTPDSCTLSALAFTGGDYVTQKLSNFLKKEIEFVATKMKQWSDLDLHLSDWFVCFRKITLWLSQNEKRKNFIIGDLRSHYNGFRRGALIQGRTYQKKMCLSMS